MKNSYTSLEAILHNTLLLHFDTWDFLISGHQAVLSYFPDCPDFETAISLELNALDGKVLIDFSSLYPLNLHPAITDLGLNNQLPKPLQDAILEFIFADTLKELSQLSSLPLSFLKTKTHEEDAQKPRSSFYFKLELEEEIVPIKISIDNELMRFAITKFIALPAKKLDLSSLELDCLFVVGNMFLTLQEIKSVEIGDVLIPSSLSHVATEKKVYLQINSNKTPQDLNYNFICSLENSTLTILEQYNPVIEEPEQSEEAEQNEHPETSEVQEENMSQEVQALDIQNLDLMLSFELERRKMCISEIEALQVGSNIVLASDPLAPVTINVLNNPFAKARIVDIDGNFALQITEIFLQKD